MNIFNDAAKFYHMNLLASQGAHATKYLMSRGISPHHRARIGLATGNGLMNFLMLKGYSEKRILDSPLFRKGSEFLRNSLVLPIEKNGDVVYFTSRTLREGTDKKHIHIPGRISFLLNEDILPRDVVIITEGFFDYLTLSQHYDNVIGSYGPLPKKCIEKLGSCKVVFIATDNDVNGTGDKLANRIAKILSFHNVIARRICLPMPPEGKDSYDVNNFFLDNHSPKELFDDLIYGAKPIRVLFDKDECLKGQKETTPYDSMLLEMASRFTKLEPSGSTFKGLCPMPGHTDTSPSFHIYPNNTWYCFGCQMWGGIFSFIKLVMGLNRNEATKFLKQYEKTHGSTKAQLVQ